MPAQIRTMAKERDQGTRVSSAMTRKTLGCLLLAHAVRCQEFAVVALRSSRSCA